MGARRRGYVNVLIVTQYFWPEYFRINDLAIDLKARGYKVAVLTGVPNYPEGRFFPGYGFFKKRTEVYNGIRVVRVPLISRGKGGHVRLALNYFSFMFFAAILAPFRFRREKFDVIFVYEPSPITVAIPAIVLKKLKKIPIILWILDLWPEGVSAVGAVRSKKVLQCIGSMVRFIYRRCDLILVSSKGFVSSIRSMGVESDRVGYFPNWAEEFYKPVEVGKDAPEYSLLPAGFRVMYAGNIGVSQDPWNILDAAERLKSYPEIHWVILGDGRMFEWFKEEVKTRGLSNNVHVMGRFPVETMSSFFALADVMLTTLKRDPVWSLVIPGRIQSYLACGKPIIAAIDGEGGRLVEETGAGLSCPAEDPDALAKAVLTMYEMPPAELRNMGLNGRSYFVKHFERSMLLNRLENWIGKIINKKPLNLHAEINISEGID